MLSKLRIDNFRAFKPLNIDRLGKINLFCGQNNSGKTSLLEAIFLLSGASNPGLLLNQNVLRGLSIHSGSKEDIQNLLWKPIFHNLDMSEPIEISGHHSSCGDLKVRLSLKQPNLFELPFDDGNVTLGEKLYSSETFVLDYILNGTPKANFNITVTSGGMQAESQSPLPEPPFPSTILSFRNRNSEENAQRLSQLRRQKQGGLIVKALQVIEPRLQSLEVNSATGTSMIWGDIGLNELVPLPVMGDGMIQLARIVLAISSTPDGVVLIDEFENGLHHSVLSKIWEVTREATEQFNTQIVATTHSYECIEAASQTFDVSDNGIFNVYRLESAETETKCVGYDKEKIKTAIEYDMEVR